MDILFDMQPRHRDPAYEAVVAQIKVYHKFFGNWPEHLHRDVEKAWKVTKERLQKENIPGKWHVAQLQPFFVTFKIMAGKQTNMTFGPSRAAMVKMIFPST